MRWTTVALLTLSCGGGPSPIAWVEQAVKAASDAPTLVVERLEGPCRVRVHTSSWMSLDDAAGVGGVAALLTEIAHRNTEPHGLRVGLRPATGEVIADRVVPCAALPSATEAQALVNDMERHLQRLHPLLLNAMQDVPL